ncbi:hypothetical protein PM082_006357 [Marasmius tenuissimus]|nr:hypothetical protein PM082_006357 [Marasmius tenuissimus]
MSTLLNSCQKCGQRIIEDIEPSPLPPPLENLLNTNDPPSSAGIPDFDIHTLIENQSRECKRALASLKSEVANLHAKVDVLWERYAATKRRLDQCNAIREPIRRIPNDILLHIFRLCVDDDIEEIVFKDDTSLSLCSDRELGTLDTTRAPWVFSFVCRRWRDLALSLPSLWTSIVVDLDGAYHSMNDNATAVVKSLELQLARCGTQSLSITFNHGTKHHRRSEEVVEVLLSKAAQWAKAQIHILPSPELGSHQFERYEGMFQQLTELQFHFHKLAPPHQYESITKLFKDALNLNKLFFRGSGRICSRSSTLQHLHFSCDHLIHFECQQSLQMGGGLQRPLTPLDSREISPIGQTTGCANGM